MSRCPACHGSVDLEHPENLRAINPLTFRMASFHGYCYQLLLEEAEQKPAASTDYDNRLDEFLSKDH